MSKKTVSVVVVVAILFVVAATTFWKASANNNEIERKVIDIQKDVDALYADEKKEMLVDGITQKELNYVDAAVKKVEDQKMPSETDKTLNRAKKELAMAEEMFDLQGKVNALLDETGALVENADIESVEKLASNLEKEKKKFVDEQRVIIEEAKAQQLAITNTVNLVNALFTSPERTEVATTATRAEYDSTKAMVDSLKQVSTKQALTSSLDQVNAKLTEQETVAQANAAAEAEKQKAQQGSNTSGSNGSTATSNDSNVASNSGAQDQAGFAGIVAGSQTAQKTDQIITTVANGTSAEVTFWEESNGVWSEVFTTQGYVGSQGVGGASESTSRTPKGAYSLGFSFGTGSNPGTALPYKQITQNSWWVSDVNSPLYNTWQESASGFANSEHMADYPTQYQYGVVINYNMSAVPGAGSGFFLHCSNGRPTAGCVAIPTSYMLQTLQRLNPGAYIINVNSEQEVANY